MSSNNKSLRIVSGILSVLFLTAALCFGLRMQMTTGRSDLAVGWYINEETTMIATTEMAVETDTGIYETVETEPTFSAEVEDISWEDATEVAIEYPEPTAGEELSGELYSALVKNEQVVRISRILFVIFALLFCGAFFVFAFITKRKSCPEGLEVSTAVFALGVGILISLLAEFRNLHELYLHQWRQFLYFGRTFGLSDIVRSFITAFCLVYGLTTFIGWAFQKGDPQFSILYRMLERIRIKKGSGTVGIIILCCVMFISFFVCAFMAFIHMYGWAYGSSFDISTALLFLFLFALTIYLLILSVRTARKMQEEMIENAKMNERYRVDLVTNVSHDLRTPLTSIIGYGELLNEEEMSEKGKEILTKLNERSAYLREMVDAVFELARVSSGEVQSKKDALDLIKLLEQTIGYYDDAITAAGFTVVRHYETETAPILSDGIFLNQIFANLLTNAIKYTMPGTRIHVEVKKTEKNYTVRMLNVASYEMKFDEKAILERFARGDDSRNSEGNGLGLAIAKTYAQAVGGNFYVEIQGDQFIAVVEL